MSRTTPRTIFALLLAILAVPGLAAAQEASAQAHVVFTSDGDADGWATPSYALHVDPRSQATKVGELATYTIQLRSRIDQTVRLDVDGPADGYRYALGATELTLSAGETARTTLMVRPNEDAQHRATFLVRSVDGEGHSLASEVHLETMRPIRHEPCCERPAEPCCERPMEPQPREPCCPPPQHAWPKATFTLEAEPIDTGDRAVVAYQIHVRSAIAQDVRLEARTSASDVVPLVEPGYVRVSPDAPATAVLRLQRSDGEDAHIRFVGMVVVTGEAADERHELRIFPRPYVHRLEPIRISLPAPPVLLLEPAAPPATQTSLVLDAHASPTYADRPLGGDDVLARRVALLEARVARLEAALRFFGLRMDGNVALGAASSP